MLPPFSVRHWSPLPSHHPTPGNGCVKTRFRSCCARKGDPAPGRFGAIAGAANENREQRMKIYLVEGCVSLCVSVYHESPFTRSARARCGWGAELREHVLATELSLSPVFKHFFLVRVLLHPSSYTSFITAGWEVTNSCFCSLYHDREYASCAVFCFCFFVGRIEPKSL